MSLPFVAWLAMMLRDRARFWLAPLLFGASASAARNSPTASATRFSWTNGRPRLLCAAALAGVNRKCAIASSRHAQPPSIQGYSQVIRGTD
jgi:hypothetical protein